MALAAGPALSASSGTVTFGNLQITLTDLDLSDGITPSLTLNYESQPYLNGAVGSFNPDYESTGYATWASMTTASCRMPSRPPSPAPAPR